MRFIDCHCDTITKLMELDGHLYENDCQLDIMRLKEFNAPIQFFAVWLSPMYYADALPVTLRNIDFYYNELKKNKQYISPAYSYEHITINKKEGKATAVLSLEGLYQIGNNLYLLNIFYKMGVRLCGLTWNFSNTLATGLNDIKKTGLTELGFEAVGIMNDIGIIVDVSHLSVKSFWDVVHSCKKPFVASHSNAFSVTNTGRNLDDSQIKAIAHSGGIIGLNFHGSFLSDKGMATLDDALLHIKHIINVGGEDSIALGSDFDGMECPPRELTCVTGQRILADAVESRFGSAIREKLSEKNMLRVIKEVWR